MLKLRRILILILLLLFSFSLWYFYNIPDEKTTIQFFPIDERVTYTELGSDLQIYQMNNNYTLVAESWSKTSEKVYLRQDVSLLFRNGFLIKKNYPWKEDTDWLVNRMEDNLRAESIYTLLTFHHAEIHQNELITSKQNITSDKLYVVTAQNDLEAFKKPQNEKQQRWMKVIDNVYDEQRNILLENGIKELNINRENYEIYNLDEFSTQIKKSPIISDEQFIIILGNMWEGLYRTYVLGFSEDELRYFSPPMPWVLVDKNGTHILIIYQLANGNYEKLIMEI